MNIEELSKSEHFYHQNFFKYSLLADVDKVAIVRFNGIVNYRPTLKNISRQVISRGFQYNLTRLYNKDSNVKTTNSRDIDLFDDIYMPQRICEIEERGLRKDYYSRGDLKWGYN